MFIVVGRRNGQPIEVSYEAGELGGDRAAVLEVLELVDERELVTLPPVGPTVAAGLLEEWRALVTVRSVFDVVDDVETDRLDRELEVPGWNAAGAGAVY